MEQATTNDTDLTEVDHLKLNLVGGEINLSDTDCLRIVKDMIEDPASCDRRLRRSILTAIRRFKYKPTIKKRSACRPCEAREGPWKPSRIAVVRAILAAFANGNGLVHAPAGADTDGFVTKAVSSHATYHAATVVGTNLGVAAAATCARVFDKMVELQANGDVWNCAVFKSQTAQQHANWLPNATKGSGILMNACAVELFQKAIVALGNDLDVV